MIFWSKKKTKDLLPSENPEIINEIEKQNEELESIKNWGVDGFVPPDVGPVLNSINNNSQVVNNNSQVQVIFAEDGQIIRTIIDPTSIVLGNGEDLLWSFDFTEGVFRKKNC